MSELKIVANRSRLDCSSTHRTCVDIDESNYIDATAIILSVSDAGRGKFDGIDATGYDIPVFIAAENEECVPAEYLSHIFGVFEYCEPRKEFYGHQLETVASHYETQLCPSFFRALVDYVNQGNSAFDCPGHQGGEFFRRYLADDQFVEYLGEMFFRSDLCNADVAMDDLLIHEGASCIAQQYATRVSSADKTYFILNGASSSNKVVLNALLTPGDLVSFGRNDHKSNHHNTLLQADAAPVYLETARNPCGFIGGTDAHCFGEGYLRELITEAVPQQAREVHPFRPAVIQLGTYDGTIYNARRVVDKTGHLYDYILFDSVQIDYEQFTPMMAGCSPLSLDLSKNDPGIPVMQSVHKQQAGFSQTSQIHRRDSHIKGQQRYMLYKRMNDAFMTHTSTNPFYPLSTALDINAKMHEGVSGHNMWIDRVVSDINACKLILDNY